MMSIIQSIILGIVQGLTEFLPVSSSGHLAIAQAIFKDFDQPGLLFDTLLHVATLLAVMVYFRKRIGKLFYAFLGVFSSKHRAHYFEQKNLLYGLIIATIPTGIIGFLLKDRVETIFDKPIVVGYLLMVTSLMLFLADRKIKGGPVTPLKALIVGIAQGLAVFPGISRSGTTIFAGVSAGISREDAAEFSFLVSIPAICGAIVLQAKNFAALDTSELKMYLLSMGVAFIFGLFAIGIMMEIVKRARMRFFAIYCLVLGISVVVLL
jgi:undecaprenyl-diphosphatase